MSAKKNEPIYSAEDIRKYLSGELSPSQMHAMEKAALDDALLADAIEGYGQVDERSWQPPLQLLRGHFSQAQRRRSPDIIPRAVKHWQAAAAVIFLAGALAITYQLLIKNGPGSKTTSSTVTKLPPNDSSTAASRVLTEDKPAPATQNSEPRQQENRNYRLARPPSPPVKPVEPQTRPITAVNPAAREATADLVADSLVQPGLINNNNRAANQFSAQVLSPDGNALPYAHITIPSQNIGTYADVKGNFRLLAPDTVLAVEIRSAGYRPLEVKLTTNAAQNKVVLSENEISLAETTVVTSKRAMAGAGHKRKSILVPDSTSIVEPEDGWNNYDTYLSNNINLPGEEAGKPVHGEVELSFNVHGDGLISNVRIDKSLCADCDEAALKAIKEGPRWKTKNGREARGKLTVRF
jgi:TonB family protein